MIARDKGVPSKQAGVTVTVIIERNPHAPSFIQRTYEADVNESIAVGSSVIKVDAQDLDGVSLDSSLELYPAMSVLVRVYQYLSEFISTLF